MSGRNSGTAVPKPLDLEEIEKDVNEKIKVVSMLGHLYIDGEYKGYVKDKEPLVVFVGIEEEDMYNIINEIKSRIKSACEFYLRYFKCPEKLVEDFPEHKKKVEQLCVKSEIFPNLYHVTLKYNEWLFRLAFRGVLDE